MPNPNKKFSLYEYERELATAFKGDCEAFLHEYERLQSLSFEEFATVWQNRKFTYVFAGQSYALVVKQLCESYFYTVKKFIMFPKNIYTQVGGFYLLYGLYYKQPIRNWVKIRLTLNEYKQLHELIETVKTYHQYDAAYIFAKMKTEDAFVYTAQAKPLGPEDRFVKSYELYYDNTFSSEKTESALIKFEKMISNDELISNLEKTNNEYQELLQKYAETCPSLSPFKSTIIENLKKATTSMEEEASSQEETTKAKQDTRSKRRQIKDKAMANKNAVYRGSRHVKMATDEDLLDTRDSDSDT